jgi:hypothetical protein
VVEQVYTRDLVLKLSTQTGNFWCECA